MIQMWPVGDRRGSVGDRQNRVGDRQRPVGDRRAIHRLGESKSVRAVYHPPLATKLADLAGDLSPYAVYHPPAGGAISRGDGDAGTLARSPRCRHQHDAQRCRYGMTKGIDARMGRDSERGSMRSTKARPRLRRGEPERSRLKQAARPHLRPRCHPRPLRRLLAAPAARRAARPGVSSPAAGQTYPTPRQACIPASRWT